MPLARRIPHAKRGKTNSETNENEVRRRSLVKIVDFLVKHEEYAPTLWELISSGTLKLPGDEKPQHHFESAPKSLCKVCKTFKAQWLISNSSGRLTAELIATHDAGDEDWINDVTCMFLKMTGTETLGDDCVDKQILNEALAVRYRDLGGESIGEWVQRALRGSSPVDWSIADAFILRWGEGGKLKEIVHRRSKLVGSVPADLNIGRAYKLENPAFEGRATLKYGELRKFALLDFFPKSAEHGPHSKALDKKGKQWRQCVEQATATINGLRNAAGQNLDTGINLKDHASERRALHLARACEAMAGKGAVKRARILDLSTS